MMTALEMLALAVAAAAAAFNGYRFVYVAPEGSLHGWLMLGGCILNGLFMLTLLLGS